MNIYAISNLFQYLKIDHKLWENCRSFLKRVSWDEIESFKILQLDEELLSYFDPCEWHDPHMDIADLVFNRKMDNFIIVSRDYRSGKRRYTETTMVVTQGYVQFMDRDDDTTWGVSPLHTTEIYKLEKDLPLYVNLSDVYPIVEIRWDTQDLMAKFHPTRGLLSKSMWHKLYDYLEYDPKEEHSYDDDDSDDDDHHNNNDHHDDDDDNEGTSESDILDQVDMDNMCAAWTQSMFF